jgi:hypothetical protein
MIILRDPQQLTQVAQPEIKTFLQQRFHDICDPEPYNPDEHGFFILIEPGDTSKQIESETGYSLLKSLFSDTVYGDADFTPNFEYLEEMSKTTYMEPITGFDPTICRAIWLKLSTGLIGSLNWMRSFLDRFRLQSNTTHAGLVIEIG